MPFTRNISNFELTPNANDLLKAYCQLVVIELSLKHSNIAGIGFGGHDIPRFLQALVLTIDPNLSPSIPGVLNGYVTRLSNDLKKITCIGKKGNNEFVSTHSYPNMRYTRLQGDWGGASETSDTDISALLQTSTEIANYLRQNTVATGVSI